MREVTLEEVFEELCRRDIAVSREGEGAAVFLFATANGRSIELAKYQGKWWVEFWEAGDDADAQSVRETLFAAPGEAVEAVSEWLRV